MNKNYFIYSLLLIVLLVGCVKKSKKIFIKKYYPSGNLLSYGWYTANSDSFAIDTIHSFYENGHRSAISIYDSINPGILNGVSTLFYKNGNLYQVTKYVKGKAQGFSFEYNQSGKLYFKTYYFNDKRVGDYLGYDTTSGFLHDYAFYWVDTSYVCYIEYDTFGKIKNGLNNRPVLFYYFTKINNDTIKNIVQKSCDIQIIPSNPPRCKTSIFIKFISKSGIVIEVDSVANIELYNKHFVMPDSLRLIKYHAIQYDSIINKYYYCNFETQL